ncbi:hypothetical protein VHUM_00798 [Vanrija humicola]|uniref:Uncharacterized protein n=1 Tax=Vanrija humicola TaxID=5417 RepID=A0A7D8YZ42_VANHU|nr:hypothetical protein VHUM_00798 [Vanrija humicola]
MTSFPLVVVGIAVDDSEDNVEGYSVDGKLEPAHDDKARPHPTLQTQGWDSSFRHTLASILPETSAFPLVKRLVLVPPQTPSPSSRQGTPARRSSAPRKGSSTGSQTVVRAPLDGGDNWVARLLGELVGEVFGELGELAASLESPAGMNILSGTLLPSLSSAMPSPSHPQSPASPVTAARSRPQSANSSSSRPPSLVHTNSLPVVPSSPHGAGRTLTPGGRPTAIQNPSAPPIQASAIAPSPSPAQTSSNPFRRSGVLSSPFNRSSSANANASANVAAALAKDIAGMAKYTTAPLAGIAGGRLLKLLGDMYLLTGMYGDAIKCYDDGAERARSVGDVLWEALAREGRAVAGVGEAWEGRDGSNLCTPFPTSPIPVEILSHYFSALACLSRSPLPFPPTQILSPTPQTASGSFQIGGRFSGPQIGTGEGLLAYLYSSLCLRISHFVLLIFAAGGWGSIALSSLISHTMPRSFPPLPENPSDLSALRKRRLLLNQLASQSHLTRTSILGHAEAALGAYKRAMTKTEQLATYVEVVWIARWLDLERKEAAATRQLASLLVQVITEGREESKRLASQLSTDTDVGKDDSGIGLGLPGSSNDSRSLRRRESAEGNASIISLFERACHVFGVDLLSLDVEPKIPTIIQTGREADTPSFGWPDLQVELLKEGIAMVEALPDHAAVIRFCLSALKALHTHLTPSNQSQLVKLYPKALSIIRRRAIDFDGIPWWIPGRIVLSVEISSLSVNKMPFEHSRTEISSSDKKEGRKDPFLYNPRLKGPGVGKTTLVANEQVDVYVTLQNVFSFDLEIQDISLLTDGVPFVTTPLPIMLPSSSVQTVRVTGMAPSAGPLQIKGVNVRLMDGSSAEILLPVADAAGSKRDSKRRSHILADAARTKRQGLEARNSLLLSADGLPALPTQQDEHKWLECQIVEEQPLLWIKQTSLTHGTVMLYNGEKSIIRITLENSSSVPVDFVKLSFEDSVSREAQVVVAEGELSPEQAYEVDYDTLNRPVFSWDSPGDLVIPPGGRTVLMVYCLGKVGCVDGSIRIDYGYVNRKEEGASSTFYTRRLTFPMLFTVYHTLECYSLDVVRLPRPKSSQLTDKEEGSANGPTSPPAFSTSADDDLQRALAQTDDRDVLFCINIRNVYSVPFEVALGAAETSDESTKPLVVTRLVPPGATERLVLPIRRQGLTQEERSRAIPSLTGRQYVVQKGKRSEAELARTRETFWFREHLLQLVEISWREPGSLRSGTLSLRDQALAPAQLDAFRLDELAVSLTVEPRHKNTLQAMDFVDLRINVANNLERPLRPYVRLEAIPTSSNDNSWTSPAPPPAPRRVSSLPATPVPVAKTVAFDGVLDAALPLLQPGESASHVVGAVLLASGTYNFRAAAEEIVPPSPIPPTVCFSPSVAVNVASN